MHIYIYMYVCIYIYIYIGGWGNYGSQYCAVHADDLDAVDEDHLDPSLSSCWNNKINNDNNIIMSNTTTNTTTTTTTTTTMYFTTTTTNNNNNNDDHTNNNDNNKYHNNTNDRESPQTESPFLRSGVVTGYKQNVHLCMYGQSPD